MMKCIRVRDGALVFALMMTAALSAAAFAQDPGGGANEDDDPITIIGGVSSRPPNTVPEPFTMAIGAGAIALYARRRLTRNAAAKA